MVIQQNLWTMKMCEDEDFFLESDSASEGSQRIFATLLANKIVDWKEYKYYVFNYDTKPRFVFVTKYFLSFCAFFYNMGKRHHSYLVEGALYDLKEEKFIQVDKKGYNIDGKRFFYKFLIYDTGIPNIIYSKQKNKYLIFYRYSKNVFEEVDDITTTVTSVTENGTMRAIFYKDLFCQEEENKIIILDDSISFLIFENAVNFVELLRNVPNGNEKVDMAAPELFYERNSFVFKPTFIVYGDACIIIKTPFGEYGEFIPIIIGQNVLLDYAYGCFKYEVVKAEKRTELFDHLILKCYWAKNDFENAVAYFDVTNGKVYHDEI